MPWTPVSLRRLLLLTLVTGILGTAAELLLLGHIDGWQQIIPLVLLGGSLVLLLVELVKRTRATEGLLLAMMGLFLISGPVGVAMHFQGNVEFEREMYPEMGGFELVQKTMSGATPVLAPGTMALLGLVGIAYVRAGRESSAAMDGSIER
jgi:hypothetical protein